MAKFLINKIKLINYSTLQKIRCSDYEAQDLTTKSARSVLEGDLILLDCVMVWLPFSNQSLYNDFRHPLKGLFHDTQNKAI